MNKNFISRFIAVKQIIVVSILTLSFLTNSYAQLPTGFVAKKLTNNDITEAVTMAHAPDGRIFIAERSGALKQLKNGIVTTIQTVSTTTAVEQGLLGIALHSNFAVNGKIYMFYTNAASTRHYLDVVVVDADKKVSDTRVMEFDPIVNGFHNGGAMLFKDGLLYICIGESNDPKLAQDLTTYHGKVLRLLDDGQPAPGNPYYNTAGANRQQRSIWAIGMRNPWFMTMDPQTKKLYVMNVGGGFEEINDITSPDATKNYNYGWGTDNKSGSEQNAATTILPVFAYNRNVPNWNAQTCAITSGLAFNPPVTNYPAQYRNKLYFGDWCTGWLRSFDLSNPTSGTWQDNFPANFSRVLGLTVGLDGNIYYSDYSNNGNIWRIEYTLTQIPQIVNQPKSLTVYENESATFSVTASGTNPLTYKWFKNNVLIPTATLSTYTITSVALANADNYTVEVTNNFGNILSAIAKLTVLPFNAPPVAKISAPLASLKWNVGTVIPYSGTATDAEDGILPASAYNWEVMVFHKDCPTCEHSHPGPNVANGVVSGTFIATNGGETSSNIWLRIYLTVTDSKGRKGIDSVDVQPNKVDLTATTNVPGLEIVLGLGKPTPYTKTAVVNASLTVQALTPQVIGNTVYTFDSWNIGGGANQILKVPATNTTYSATYTSSTVGPDNLALRKRTSTSSIIGGNVGARAVDGNSTTTRWESLSTDPQWIQVDLGAVYTVTRVKIFWENASSKDYLIEVSNDSTDWGTPAKSVLNNNTFINEWSGLTGVGRYIRIYGTARTTVYGHSIYELEVYGALSPNQIITSTNDLDVSENQQLVLYPNPALNEVSLKGIWNNASKTTVAIYDMSETLVFEKNISAINNSGEDKVDISSLSSGIYVVKITSGNNTIRRKLIKN